MTANPQSSTPTCKIKEIDWTPFDGLSESSCECTCGTSYRTHAKFVGDADPHIAARIPCPSCGGTRLRRASSDIEVYTLGITEKL